MAPIFFSPAVVHTIIVDRMQSETLCSQWNSCQRSIPFLFRWIFSVWKVWPILKSFFNISNQWSFCFAPPMFPLEYDLPLKNHFLPSAQRALASYSQIFPMKWNPIIRECNLMFSLYFTLLQLTTMSKKNSVYFLTLFSCRVSFPSSFQHAKFTCWTLDYP